MSDERIYQHVTGDEIKCPVCGSAEWTCWDERIEDRPIGEPDEEGSYAVSSVPVGYMKCPNNHVYTHEW